MTTSHADTSAIDAQRAKKIEEEFETERRMRPVAPRLGGFVAVFLVVFAIYHYVTAGIGIPIDYWHMGIHMSGVILLVFIAYPMIRNARTRAADFVLDAIVLPNPYAYSFGTFLGLATSAWFAALQAQTDRSQVVMGPPVALPSGETSLTLAVAVVDAQGALAGAVAATVEPGALVATWDPLPGRPGDTFTDGPRVQVVTPSRPAPMTAFPSAWATMPAMPMVK